MAKKNFFVETSTKNLFVFLFISNYKFIFETERVKAIFSIHVDK